MSLADLAPLLVAGADLSVLVDALGTLTAADRSAMSGQVVKAGYMYQAHGGSFLRTPLPPLSPAGLLAVLAEGARYDPRIDQRALFLLTLGCASDRRIALESVSSCLLSSDEEELAVRVLRDRNPSWLAEVPMVLASDPETRGWWLSRRLIKHGLAMTPTLESYHLGVIEGICSYRFQGSGVLELLLADPDLLETDVWPMLRSERAGRRLAQVDSVPNFSGWIPALTELAASGVMERSRLLEVALAACVSDWRPVDVGWYRALHTALAPTLPEVAVQQQFYLTMLTAAPGQTVQLAQEQLGRLAVANRLDIDGFIEASEAVLARSEKARPLAQFKLLEALLKVDSELAAPVADVATSALSHPHPDVRDRAARIAKVTKGQHSSAPVVSPTVPGTVRARQQVEPVRDADELAEVFGWLIADASDPIAVERALEGVVRLAGVRPTRGMDALARKAETFLAKREPGAWSGEDIRADLMTLVLTWLRGTPPTQGRLGRELGYLLPDDPFRDIGRSWILPAFVSLRVLEVAQIVLAGGGRILSLPSLDDGSISAEDLAQRVAALPFDYRGWPLDLAQTALRLQPGTAIEGGQVPGRLAMNLAVIAKYSPDWQPVFGRSDRPLNAAIAKAPAWRDAAAPVGLIADPLRGLMSRGDPLPQYGAEVDLGTYTSGYEQAIGLWPLVFPHHLELLSAHSHPRMFRAIEYGSPPMAALPRALGASPGPVGPVTYSALALGLSAKDLGERTVVVDAVIDLLDRELLDSRAFGVQVAHLLAADTLIGNRVAQALSDLSAARPAAAAVCIDVLEQVLPVLPGRRDAHLFVDLLASLLPRSGREVLLPDEFQRLRAGKGTSMVAKALRRL